MSATHTPLPRIDVLSPATDISDAGGYVPLVDIAPKVREIELLADPDKYAPRWGYITG